MTDFGFAEAERNANKKLKQRIAELEEKNGKLENALLEATNDEIKRLQDENVRLLAELATADDYRKEYDDGSRESLVDCLERNRKDMIQSLRMMADEREENERLREDAERWRTKGKLYEATVLDIAADPIISEPLQLRRGLSEIMAIVRKAIDAARKEQP